MGVADFPRVTFSGFVYWNPSTMNNNDYQPTYDPASATLSWAWLERHGLDDADAFDTYVTRPAILANPNDELNPAINTAMPPAEWNFYGGNDCGFVQPDDPVIEWPEKFSKPRGKTVVNGFTDLSGTRVTGGDPWIGQPVGFNDGLDTAKLVDVDPVCVWSSQIFNDTFHLGSDAAEVGFTAPTLGRAHSRWMNVFRNYAPRDVLILAGKASAMFQVAMASDDIRIRDRSPASGSLASQLQKALDEPHVRGLMVRFVTYKTVYFQGDAFEGAGDKVWPIISKLYTTYAAERAAYERGERDQAPPVPVNRAYSNTVGWVAPWTVNDMRSAATGRLLYGDASPTPVDGNLQPPVPLGPAAVEVVPKGGGSPLVVRVAVDLGSTIPERDVNLGKVDYGTMQLAVLRPDDAEPQPFAAIPYKGGYDADAYVAGAGVVDIPHSKFLFPVEVTDLDYPIVVTLPGPSSTPVTALREAELAAETDDRGVYLEEPGAPPRANDVRIEVRHRGGPPPPGTRLRIAQYSPDFPGFNEAGWQLVSDTGATLQAPYERMAVTGGTVEDGAWVIVAVPAAVGGHAYSVVTMALSALRSGPSILQLTPLAPTDPPAPPPPVLPFPANLGGFFANVRVLPFHNAMAAAFVNWLRTGPSADVATQRVFDAVFRTYFLMYPRMRFLRDPLQFQAWRGPVLAVTDPSGFESGAYMPVTRSLSAGQRQMLEAWDHYLAGALATPKMTGEPRARR